MYTFNRALVHKCPQKPDPVLNLACRISFSRASACEVWNLPKLEMYSKESIDHCFTQCHCTMSHSEMGCIAMIDIQVYTLYWQVLPVSDKDVALELELSLSLQRNRCHSFGKSSSISFNQCSMTSKQPGL